METIGNISNLQPKTILGHDDTLCLHSKLMRFDKKVDASPYSIKMVLSGKEHYHFGSYSFSLNINDFLVVNRGESVQTIVDSAQTVEGLCIYPPPTLINEVYQSFISTEIDHEHTNKPLNNNAFHLTTRHIRANSQSEITKAINRWFLTPLKHKCVPTEEQWYQMQSALTYSLVAEQLALSNKLKRLKAKNKSTQEEMYRRVQKTIDYMHDNKYGDLNIEVLAEVSNLSKFHFIRTFKELIGKSPYQFVLHLKKVAAQELVNQGNSIAKASLSVGYSDPNNLRKALKQMK